MNVMITEETQLEIRGGIQLDKRKLSPQEGFLLSRIKGPTTVKELYRISMVDQDATATIIKRLVDNGILQSVGGNAAQGPGGVGRRGAPKKDEYNGFIFDLQLMQEDVDLTVDQRKDIIFTHQNMEGKTFFQVLGVPYDAGAARVKKAFLSKSKKYHPDRFFRRRLGSFERMINEIYSSLSRAQFTLLDPVKKREYLKKLEKEGKLTNSDHLENLEKEERARQQRIRDALKNRRLKRNPLMERVKKAKEYYEAGRMAVERENYLAALNNFRLASSFDPHNEIYRAKVDEVIDRANLERARKMLQKAQMGQTYNRDDFLDQYEEAADLGQKDHSIQFAAAQAFLENEMPAKARTYLRRAVKLAPKNIDYKMILGTLLLRTKKRQDAVELFEEVLKLKPGHDRAKELLKEAKKWF